MHFALLVKFEGSLEDAKQTIKKMLRPYSMYQWVIGGRFSGMMPIKEGGTGIEGEPGVFNNPVGIDIALVENIDWDSMDDFATFAVLDKGGWHEWGDPSDREMEGWLERDKEREMKWRKEFRERFLLNLAEETVLAIVDCHI